jgi:gluconolactonase
MKHILFPLGLLFSMPACGSETENGSPEVLTGPVDPLARQGAVELIRDGFVFLEGPAWDAASGRLFFTDVQANTIHAHAPPASIDVVRNPSNLANGLAFDREGQLIVCEMETRRVTRTLADGSIEVIADEFEGKKFNAPNDVAVRSDGTLYFTDPGFRVTPETRELDFNGLFRVDGNGAVHAEWKGALTSAPNGVALSPNEQRLYLADTLSGELLRFEVLADGSLGEPSSFVQGETLPDGMAVDRHGNVLVATGSGIEAWSPDATRWGLIQLDRIPANVGFGGSDGSSLFITAREGLYRVTLP